ncbi:hypothetical protein Daesc_006149 [Daldinia eschscholtzii]|uniref:EKC/KEOPS complex subunit BUD32 n=1 Tax=Daldinia eschscholtzii TaxID=292717 RepID=A0AAX6MGT3_9PEZI
MEVLSPLATDYLAGQPHSYMVPSDGTTYYHPINYSANVEDVQLYNEGGHYPVHLGVKLDNRFTVVHKLGSGGYGIVWLCRDTYLEKWRAVKILTANQTAKGTENEIICDLQKRFTEDELERNHILLPLERFWLTGPNGTHLCLVMPVLGPAVSSWRLKQKDYEKQTHHDTRNLCRQIMASMHFLHRHGICHGDFRPSNILMKIEGIDHLSEDQLLKLMGEPECIGIEPLPGQSPTYRAPKYCVVPAHEFWSMSLSTKSITIIDFGESFFTKDPPKSTGIPDSYAAPEVLLEGIGNLGTHTDIWSLACTLFEVRTGSKLVEDQLCGGFSDSLGEIEFYLGPLPSRYRMPYDTMHSSIPPASLLGSGGPESQLDIQDYTPEEQLQPDAPDKDYFEEARAELREKSGYQDIFQAVLGQERTLYCNVNTAEKPEVIKYRYPQKDVLGLADLLKKMLKYDPKDRIGINSVVSHYWLGRRSKGNTRGDTRGSTRGKLRSKDDGVRVVVMAVAVTVLILHFHKFGKKGM